MKNAKQRGNTQTIIAVSVLVIILGGLLFLFNGGNERDEMEEFVGESMEKEMNEMMENGEVMMEKDEEDNMTKDNSGFSGKLLGGSFDKSPLLDFTKEDYDKAIASDKLVTLYFYANWCPSCRLEFPKMEDAFDGLDSDEVIGFRVNYNDNQTDDFERGLAKEFGVAYQHTKVFVRDGERILKSPESWNRDRYLSEINTLIQN